MDEKPWGDTAIEVFSYAITLPMFFGPGVLAWQGFNWLVTGVWTQIPASAALDYFELPHPTVKWVGLQQVIDQVLNFPLSASSFLLWLALFMLILASISQISQAQTRKPIRKDY